MGGGSAGGDQALYAPRLLTGLRHWHDRTQRRATWPRILSRSGNCTLGVYAGLGLSTTQALRLFQIWSF